MRTITKLLVQNVQLSSDTSALELLESIGKVEISGKIFQGGMECRITIGEWGDAQLSFWGVGQNICEAAKATVAKLEASGVLDDLRQMSAKISSC